jgi:hypothetical protein
MASDCRPILEIEAVAQGAIAQLGERVVRNDEVGGSIPPGSTTLRPSGFAWRSHVIARRTKRGARQSPKGDDGLAIISDSIYQYCVFGLRVATRRATTGWNVYVVRLHQPQR